MHQITYKKSIFWLFYFILHCCANNNKLEPSRELTTFIMSISSFDIISVVVPEPIMFDDSLKITSVSFFIADFKSLRCEFNHFAFKLLY